MNSNSDFQIKVSYDLSVTILTGETKSNGIDLGGGTLAGVFLPSNYVGTGFSLEASNAIDGTYIPVSKDDGNPYAAASVALSEYVALNTEITKGLRFIKIVAATAQTTNDKTIRLATRSLS